MVRECICSHKKTHKVTFDGGSSGDYVINFCQKCYDSEDKEFVKMEVRI